MPLRVMDMMPDGRGDNVAITGLLDAARNVADTLAGDDDIARREILDALLDRVEIRESCIVVHLRPSTIFNGQEKEDQRAPVGDGNDDTILAVELPVKLRRRGTGTRITIAGDAPGAGQPDANLIGLIVDAHRWNRMLAEGEVGSLRQLAMRESRDTSDISRALNLAHLAPDIVEAILDGLQPAGLTASKLRRMRDLPLDWQAQRKALGFHA